MSATTDPEPAGLAVIRSREHPNCIVCGPDNPCGLHVDFHALDGGGVEAVFACKKAFEGYGGVIHGGVLCALVDSAMLHCLFVRGRPGVTADLSVQFRHPVITGHPAQVRAWMVDEDSSLYTLRAEVVQEGQVKVRATGRFLAKGPRPADNRKDHGIRYSHDDC